MCQNPCTKKSGEVFPCSRCPECIARRISAWSFRMMQQERISESSHFITMTYANKHLPYARGLRATLEKTDIQKFFKRLRKAQRKKEQSDGKAPSKISYYCAGEYGTRTKRPHYHIIMFNANIDLLQPAWDKGDIHYGKVTGASVGYTLKYISKPRVVGTKANDFRQREFSLMSKKLGANYLTKAMVKWHLSNVEEKMYLNLEDGKKISMPRYYKDKIYTTQQREQIAWHYQQKVRKELEEFNSSPDFEVLLQNKKAGLKAAYERMYYKSTKMEKV